MKRNNQIKINLSIKKKEEIESLFKEYEDLMNISSYGNKSDIFGDAIINHLNNLLASYVPHTHTKSQSLTAQRKDAIFSMIETIKEKGYMFLMQIYPDLILSNDCFSDVKMRSRSSYFQSLLQSEDIFFINLSYYHDTTTRYPIVAIHRQSKWWPQLKDLCFKIKEPIFKLTHDQTSDAKLRHSIFDRMKRRSKYKSNIDKAEKTMLNAFLYEIHELNENPLYDQTDLALREVIQLRSELKFYEAEELLQQEKSMKSPVVEDDGIKFLEALDK